jgi:hypothetical protein
MHNFLSILFFHLLQGVIDMRKLKVLSEDFLVFEDFIVGNLDLETCNDFSHQKAQD